MIVKGRMLIRTTDERRSIDGYYSICGLTGSLSHATNNGKRKWTVHVNVLKSGMYIGICQIQKAIQHRFKHWGWWNIGHGHYCIVSNGSVYSHSDVNVNCKRKSFEFDAGDVLQFEYDSINGKLKVVKNKNEQYEMDIEKSKEQQYAICSYLHNSEDCVELMD